MSFFQCKLLIHDSLKLQPHVDVGEALSQRLEKKITFLFEIPDCLSKQRNTEDCHSEDRMDHTLLQNKFLLLVL